jgi:hypothetical protein
LRSKGVRGSHLIACHLRIVVESVDGCGKSLEA